MSNVGGEKKLDCHGIASNQAYSKKKKPKTVQVVEDVDPL
jgi:hypothetical protein